MSDEAPWPDAPSRRSRVAGYRLDEQIGRGGMAVVYRAHDLRLDRQVALKILAPVLAEDEAFRQRFIRESRAAAAVDHPNIIPVFDAGRGGRRAVHRHALRVRPRRADADRPGRPAAAPGGPARSSPRWRALDAAHAAGPGAPGRQARQHAARRGPGRRRPTTSYLSDFGLSKQALSASRPDRDRPVPRHARLRGAGADRGPPGGRADRPVRAGLRGVRDALRRAAVPARPARWRCCGRSCPSRRRRSPAAVPTCRPRWTRCMAKALAKSPGDRYARCLDFAAALRAACLPGRATSAARTGQPGRRRSGRHRRPAAARRPSRRTRQIPALIPGAADTRATPGRRDPAGPGWASLRCAVRPGYGPPSPRTRPRRLRCPPGPPTVPPSEAAQPRAPAVRHCLAGPAPLRPPGSRPARRPPGAPEARGPGSGGAPHGGRPGRPGHPGPGRHRAGHHATGPGRRSRSAGRAGPAGLRHGACDRRPGWQASARGSSR